jgi:nucleotide-binding universal stress UspA family protein
MYRSLLVPLDGSHFAEQALPYALSIAHRAGAALRIVHVIPPLPLLFPTGALFRTAEVEKRVRAHSQVYLDDVVQRVRQISAVPVTSALLEGDVVLHLLEEARAGHRRPRADLVVMTTHGRGPLSRFWLGSVADTLMRGLPLSLLVRPQEEKLDLGREPVFEHVLLPLDGLEGAEQAVEPGVALGALMGADFTLLRVINPLPLGPTAISGLDMSSSAPELLDDIAAVQEHVRAEAVAYLESVAERLRSRGLRVTTRVMDEQPPSASILEAAAPPIDLIAMAIHGRQVLSRVLLGNVSDKVIRGATVPVLVHWHA